MHQYMSSPETRDRIQRLSGALILDWPLPNCWLGVSIENQKYAEERLPCLLASPAALRFVSYEPALEAVDFSRYLANLDWIIVAACEL
jgi:protein gp37